MSQSKFALPRNGFTFKQFFVAHDRCAMKVGTDGILLEKGLTTHLVEGAEMIKTMAGQAERKILLADTSKFGRSGFVSIMPLSKIDTLITGTDFDSDSAETLKAQGMSLILV